MWMTEWYNTAELLNLKYLSKNNDATVSLTLARSSRSDPRIYEGKHVSSQHTSIPAEFASQL
jgi:hypothetical protein